MRPGDRGQVPDRLLCDGGDETAPPTASCSWDGAAYDDQHGYVTAYGEDVLEWLDPQPGERILDVGCGTGHLTADIAAAGADAVGIDAAADMVESARETYADGAEPDGTDATVEPGELSFQHVDARAFDPCGSFDAVFSNAALHWIPGADHDDVLELVRTALSDEGRFVAELGGTGNVEQILSATLEELQRHGSDPVSPWYFPGIDEYAPRLGAHGLEPRRMVLFDRPTDLDGGSEGLRNWLDVFGESLFADVPAETESEIVDAVTARLEPRLYDEHRETWTAGYRRLRFEARLVD